MALVEASSKPEKAAVLVSKAKAIVDADFGVKDGALLAEGFQFVRPFEAPLDKKAYLATYSGYGLRAAFPDLYWNAHDFRVDKFDSNRVWATIRAEGTHRGTFTYGKKEIPATGKRVEASPECVTFVFEDVEAVDPRCVRMTGGFCMDRTVGATGVAGGIWGLLNAIGSPVSSWQYLPPASILGSVFGRSLRTGKGSGLKEAPLAEGLMIGVAQQFYEGIVRDAASAAGLMADDFEFSSPLAGPLKKKALLAAAAGTNVLAGIPDAKTNTYDYRLDPFDPAVVWFTSRLTGTQTGTIAVAGKTIPATNKTIDLGPEMISLTFNKQGFICKMSANYPMDPALGNSGGITGFLGLLEAIGKPAPEVITRPVPVSVRLFFDKLRPKLPAKKPAAPKAAVKPAAAAPAKAKLAPAMAGAKGASLPKLAKAVPAKMPAKASPAKASGVSKPVPAKAPAKPAVGKVAPPPLAKPAVSKAAAPAKPVVAAAAAAAKPPAGKATPPPAAPVPKTMTVAEMRAAKAAAAKQATSQRR